MCHSISFLSKTAGELDLDYLKFLDDVKEAVTQRLTERVDVEYCDQFCPFDFESLQSIERAAEIERERARTGYNFQALYKHSERKRAVLEMATGNDVVMEAASGGEPAAKSQKMSAEEVAAEADKRKAILSSVSDSGLKGFMEWTFGEADKNSSNRSALNDSVVELDRRVAKIDERQVTTEARLLALEKRDAGSVQSGASTTSPGTIPSTFQATFLECHGWVTDWSTPLSRSQSMIGDGDALQLMKNVVKILREKDELIHSCIDEEGTERMVASKPMHASLRIRFKMGTDKDMLYTALQTIVAINNDVTLRLNLFSEMSAPLIRIRFRVEAPPWKIPHNQAVGRFYGEWSKLHAAVAIKGSVGAGKTPSTMWTDVVDGKRLQFAEFRAAEFGGTGQWVVFPDVWTVFSQRHSFREDARAVEASVATRKL